MCFSLKTSGGGGGCQFSSSMKYFDPLQSKLNIAQVLQWQLRGDIDGRFYRNRLQTLRGLLSRLELETELLGHTGCVNCLEWNDNGQLLASGSDDFHIMLWDPFRHKVVQDLVTPHRGNIFSVKFMPNTDAKTLISAAGDARIYAFDLNHTDAPIFRCSCHETRIKRLAVASETPHLFWSASEDGCVFQYDLREPHQCRSEDKIVLINLKNHCSRFAEIKCIATNPRRPELLAVGANDAYVRLYDRRLMSCDRLLQDDGHDDNGGVHLNGTTPGIHPIDTWRHNDHLPKSCVTYFAPGHLQSSHMIASNKAATFVSFSPNGRELLVNLGSEQIYLYDIYNSTQPTIFELPPYDGGSSGEAEHQAKRLHLMMVPDEVEEMKKHGNTLLKASKFTEAINQYTRAILETPTLCAATLYHNRATALMKRKFRGDCYAALRDCKKALQLDPSYFKAHFRMTRALLEIEMVQEAKDCLEEFKNRFADHASDPSVKMLEKDLDTALNTTTTNGNGTGTQQHERFDLSDNEIHWRSLARDYNERFVGTSNSKTDIKEANFFGQDGKYIVAGSDDGNLFIFERPSGAVIDVLAADKSIVNCVQPHPFLCLLASSGIDNEIRLWSPQPEEESNNKPKHRVVDINLHENHLRMSQDPFESNSFPSTVCRTS